jgi:hypothetical protein
VGERPILFSGPMVRAILEGRKTQTRRVLKWQYAPATGARFIPHAGGWQWLFEGGCGSAYPGDQGALGRCPFGIVGDQLWVRETWAKAGEVGDEIEYRADNHDPAAAKWRPSIFMPRWASRLTLEVVGVRVERLQDISDADAMAEGIQHLYEWAAFPRRTFQNLWDSINAERAPWASNPWVWVVEFKPLSLSSQKQPTQGTP